MATLFSGNLDLGNVSLRPGRGQATKAAKDTASAIARYVAYRKAAGNSPYIHNKATTPSFDNY